MNRCDSGQEADQKIPRLMLLFAIAGLLAPLMNFACLEDVCADGDEQQVRQGWNFIGGRTECAKRKNDAFGSQPRDSDPDL